MWSIFICICILVAGIPPEKLVEAHGGFYTASCTECYKKHDPEKTRSSILNGKIVYCEKEKCKVSIWKIVFISLINLIYHRQVRNKNILQ